MLRQRLPLPEAEAARRCEALTRKITEEIRQAGGSIGFDRYMEMALYDPQWGYYRSCEPIFGREGDFITAPEISPLFGQCLAKQCGEMLDALGGGDILEFGAGSGKLAYVLLHALQTVVSPLPRRYLILELGAGLRRQQEQLLGRLPVNLRDRVSWLDTLPHEFSGVALANEVFDAMPVKLFVKRGGRPIERRVRIDKGLPSWHEEEASSPLRSAIEAIENELGSVFPDGYCSEINFWLEPWMRSLGACMRSGVLLAIDYGYPRREYYHPQRSMGTLICHYRQHWHDDPFFHPGLQDISANVDFTGVAQAGAAAGLEVLGYTSQAQFLLGCGVKDLVEDGSLDPLRASELKCLLLPSEMGERFKAIALARGYGAALSGFMSLDLRHVL